MSYCVQIIKSFQEIAIKQGFNGDKVFTSKDFDENDKKEFSARKLADEKIIDSQFADHIPKDGEITKWALPFVFEENSALFIVKGKRGSVVKAHKHDKAFVRVILKGEITFTDLPNGEITLKSGDWIYFPSNQKYGYKIGSKAYQGLCCYCTTPWG
jgi:quercetin dioxygenase-like cupin family protein